MFTLHLTHGRRDPDEDMGCGQGFDGPVIHGIKRLRWLYKSWLHLDFDTDTLEGLDWSNLANEMLGNTPDGDMRIMLKMTDDMITARDKLGPTYYGECWVEETEPLAPEAIEQVLAAHFAYRVGQTAAALLDNLKEDHKKELYCYSNCGFVGLWTTCSAVAIVGEKRLGSLWQRGEREFIEDVDKVVPSILAAAEYYGMQPDSEHFAESVWDRFLNTSHHD